MGIFNSPLSISLFIWVQDWVKTEFQIEVLALIQNLTENRIRDARGLVHNIASVTFIICTEYQISFGIQVIFQDCAFAESSGRDLNSGNKKSGIQSGTVFRDEIHQR